MEKMLRRTFLIIIALLGFGFFAIFSIDSSFMRKIFYKIQDFFKSPIELPPDSERLEAELPPQGESVSIETALNSRCNSDYDGDPKRFHWGMFDRARKLTDEQIRRIIELARIPRFTDRRVEIQSNNRMLTFVIDNQVSGLQREHVMVESGMQQQAVGLVCAALGVGNVFRNLGKDGTAISDSDYGTVNIKADAMQPSYNGSFWSSLSPAGRKSHMKGNLPEPARAGEMPLISALGRLKIENTNGKKSTDESVSQLLWAARGRTPHLYKSRRWGMTIPTWGGEQNISTVYLISNNELSKYINWGNSKPAHLVLSLNKVENHLINNLQNPLFPNQRFIIIGRNEEFSRALWEVGYQLMNLLLQAHSLGIIYHAELLDEARKGLLSRIGINDPVAMLAI